MKVDVTYSKIVYLGGIEHNGNLVKTFVSGLTKHDLLYNMDTWFLDYFIRTEADLRKLPPLDDWNHSEDDETYWTINFPNENWKLWIRSEKTTFKNG